VQALGIEDDALFADPWNEAQAVKLEVPTATT
jgi:hypothetical protein